MLANHHLLQYWATFKLIDHPFVSARKANITTKLLLYVPAIIITVLLFSIFDPLNNEGDVTRFVLVSFGFHLLVSFTAFIGRWANVNAFWQFNKTLFLRFLAGGLYAGVLYAGLAAAIASLNFLFNLKIDPDTYAIVWVWIAVMFQTLFFLSGIPLNWNELNDDDSYPKGLMLFTQYVLIPLATIYVAILLSYEAKILVQWKMPQGLVSSLILGYSVFGMLAILLVFPLRKLEGNKWINSFSRYFYFLLLPLLVLLFLAIFARIKNYGITEERYFVLVLALWLSAITGYFLLSRRQNIMLIPISLCIVTLIADFGPLNAFNVSRNSQEQELKRLFERAGALRNGKIRPLTEKLDSLTTERIIDVSQYLVNKYGLESLQPLIETDFTKVRDSIKSSLNIKGHRSSYSRYQSISAERKWLTNHYNIPGYYAVDFETKNLTAANQDLVPLEGMDYAVEISYYRGGLSDTTQLPSNKKLIVVSTPSEIKIILNNDSTRFSMYRLITGFEAEIENKSKGRNQIKNTEDKVILPRSVFRKEFSLGGKPLKLLFNSIDYSVEANKRNVTSVDATILLSGD